MCYKDVATKIFAFLLGLKAADITSLLDAADNDSDYTDMEDSDDEKEVSIKNSKKVKMLYLQFSFCPKSEGRA